jgi:DNA repair exonuclease SbcCD ATPase subunit
MLKIKSVTMRNFMSTGNVAQAVNLEKQGLTLVLGENLDLGGNGSRNGVGKTTLINAISYGLYGQAISNIKRENLINKINGKNMMVAIDFEVNGHHYRIERGRKPTFFRYIVDDQHVNSQDTDESQGESKDTQGDIDRILGMSHTLFKHIVALNTYTEPFLSLGAGKQREIIEELLGITQLSKKADNLKELIKATKMQIDQEEFRIRTVKTSNEKIQNTIREFEKKVADWDHKRETEIETLTAAIEQLSKLDVEAEIAAHNDAELYKELSNGVAQFTKEIQTKQRHVSQLESQLNQLVIQYTKANDHKECPMCGQNVVGHKHADIVAGLESRIAELDGQISTDRADLEQLQSQLEEIKTVFDTMAKPVVFYSSLREALEHKNTLEQLHKDLAKEQEKQNPYADQADSLNNTLQEVSYDELNKLVKSREHQEFLLKLLTSKDSFIRKRIIDQNLSYLNKRLGEYLDKLGLPHEVKFLNDLSTEITLLGQDLDFDNLSRGERTRLILGLSMSFRDIFENTNTAIDLIFVDELLDSGMDAAGLEGSIGILKKMERERNKNVFVISHREELVNRVSNVLTVVKENGFTSFNFDYEASE